jgi:hypothetical protein
MITSTSQSWSPPQELLLPAPRPVTGKKAAANRTTRIICISFFSIAAVALSGWLLIALLLAPGGTLNARWEWFNTTGQAGVWLFLSFLLYPIFLVSAVFSYRGILREQRLLELGKPARAVVTKVQPYIVRRGNYSNRCYGFSVEYWDDRGNPVKSEVFLTTPSFAENDVLTVLYHPDKPSKCIAYPVPGYEIGHQ